MSGVKCIACAEYSEGDMVCAECAAEVQDKVSKLESALRSVWVAESGDYEQRGISGVFRSPCEAIALIKKRYTAPYVVTWDEPKQDTHQCWHLTGHFEAVMHYSTKHDCTWDIEEMEVEALVESAPDTHKDKS